MAKKAAIITVHGMGRTDPSYADDLRNELKLRLGTKFQKLHFGRIYYQHILQPNEDRVWNAVGPRVRWDGLRQFLLFGFADAAGLESSKDGRNSGYWLAQIEIAKELLRSREAMKGDGPVLVLAQSLGGQVASCYFWDANCKQPGAGIWTDIEAAAKDITGGRVLTAEEIGFLRGSNFKVFFTTGCNIPVFVAAHAKDKILPIQPNKGFRWLNYYDRDDVLGWPLAELSAEYSKVVEDVAINAGGGVFNWLIKSWNPMSHTQYWADDDVLDPLEAQLRSMLG